MRLLFFGDISGRSGRDAVQQHLPSLIQKYKAEAVILNAENAAGGFGITMKIAEELFALGATCLTTGNHVWKQRELLTQIDREPRLLRPLNFREGTPGRGAYLHTLPDGRTLLIANIIGRLFMDHPGQDPFQAADKLLSAYPLGRKASAIFIDFHAEATSEKQALGFFCDGRVSAMVGTHTHVPTADARILPKGTGFQTDAGMCGDYNSVIGVKAEASIAFFTRDYPAERFAPAEGPGQLAGTFIETDDRTGLACCIEGIQVK